MDQVLYMDMDMEMNINVDMNTDVDFISDMKWTQGRVEKHLDGLSPCIARPTKGGLGMACVIKFYVINRSNFFRICNVEWIAFIENTILFYY